MFESAGVALAILLPFLIIVAGLLAALAWAVRDRAAPPSVGGPAADGRQARPVGTGTRIATWAAVTALTLWCGYVLAFALVHALLFTFGSDVALVAMIVCVALLVATPFAWGVLILRRGHAVAHH